MKKIAVMTLMLISLNGCAHMPDWVLRAHVEGYNQLHPDDQLVNDDSITNSIPVVVE